MRGLVFTITLAFALVAASGGAAQAFCGFYVSGADTKLFANASQVVLMREGTRTVLSMQNDYQGPPQSFALVVPVPVVLQKENVKTLPRELFARIEQLDAPRLVEYWERDPCAAAYGKKAADEGKAVAAVRPRPSAGATSKDLGVTIEAEFTVGEYDIVVLGAKDSSGLDTWLRREGYKLPEGSEPLLRPYVQSGSKFFVAKVDVAKVKMEGGKATLSPLRFHYDAPSFALPIRLGLVSSAGTQDLVVHVLAKGKRYEVANYPNVTIPTNLDVAESAKGAFGAFYAALFDRTVAQTPHAVVTEYAWDAGSCDPCPAPPLSDAELVTLGADVLPSVSSETDLMERDLLSALGADAGPKAPVRPAPASGPVPRRKYYGLRSSFVLTRLHARYTRDSLAEDLLFREAPPLVGGREERRADGALETAAVVASDAGPATNGFQGRYAVRHAWAGPIACPAPVRNVWGGPPNGLDNGGVKPAVGLAYAPRGNMQLAPFLRTDVSALGVVAAGAPPSGVGTFAVPGSPPPDIASPTSDAGSAAGPGGDGAEGAKKSGCAGCATTPSTGADAGGLLVAAGVLALLGRRRSSRNAPLAVLALAGAIGACSGGPHPDRDEQEARGGAGAPAVVSPSPRPAPSPLLPVAGAGLLAPSLARIAATRSVAADAAASDVPLGSGDANADVEECAQCHADVASQWRKSAHAFASFDNPAYRVVVDRFRKDRGERKSQFCGGCHDVALLIDGAMLSSIEPADLRAQAGITCKTCHSVDASRADGNASWDLDLSPIPVPKEGDPDSLLRHRARVGRATLRTAALCSSCHKAFLDESTGNQHHLVGQDDVSPWERSAFAGSEAARIDDDVPRRDCRGCHMPRVAATRGDAGAKKGSVASHLFLGGHTWLASMQGDAELVAQSQAFLADRVSLDVGGLRHESGRLDVVGPGPVALVRGEHAVVDVALRNLDVGHRFPGGVMDAQGTWLEITIDDKQGRRVAEAGTAHETTGADPTAHVLSSYMARADGTRLDVRETHEFAAGVFNNTLAPRDATVVGYGFVAPDDASRYPLTVTARLRHRSRNLELQRAACADSRTERGRAFGRAGSKKIGRALDACRVQPVTELARAVVWVNASADANADANANANAVAARAEETPGAGFARRYAYGLGLSHALSERLDDARAPLLAALELARTPRQRAMALGALAMIAAREGRTDETFALAERADAAAREAGMPPPIAMQRARAEVLASTWKLADAAPLFLDVASRAPRDDTAWAAAAMTFGGAGDTHAALDAARHGLAVQPRDGDLLRIQALSLQDPLLGVDASTRAAAEAAFLERRTPDAAPAVRGTCSANVPGCANERIPVHVHAMRRYK